MTTVLINGSKGQIAQELHYLVGLNQYSGFNFIFLTKKEWNIADEKMTESIFLKYHPDIIINTAAYTKVDQAEIDFEECYAINSYAVRILAQICERENVKLIHYSSDYVFHDLLEHIPLTENQVKSPKGVYANSKSKAEDYIASINPSAIIIRSSWIYSSFGHNFVKTIIKLASERKELKIVNDQIGSPTYAYNIAELTLLIITKGYYKNMSGIFHFADKGNISWYDFATEIVNQVGSATHLIPISTSEYNAKAPRPQYSVLNCGKIEDQLHIKMKPWKESLMHCINRLKNEM
ncbi:MAG: dTDP-4-dehydrorhamnose reductase [Saprospiraceae bacterium]|nr:dTDP-4-dehydrorhamnose reductase [Saprospiraceae bacterium]